uniref:Reverse transcriptase domain-containing protein n=1 Tax=Oryzias latipes TaxID=8090 RepID=A0A3B3HLM2_ORYLA
MTLKLSLFHLNLYFQSFNITKKEMAAIHNLKNNREITILPVDKGRTTVILDTEQYEKQMDEILHDRNTYEALKKDPTEAKKKKLKTILKQLQDEKKIDKQTYNHLIPTANIIPRIYGTPKIHKPGAPLRPIIDSMGSVTYNLSKFIADILKPLLGNTDYHCENMGRGFLPMEKNLACINRTKYLFKTWNYALKISS